MKKSLKFKHELAELILAGKKNCTWRLFDDKDLKTGDVIDLVDSDTKEKFGEANLIHVYERKMGELVDADFEGHEKFVDQKMMYKTYSSYYGRDVGPDAIVKIIRFQCET